MRSRDQGYRFAVAFQCHHADAVVFTLNFRDAFAAQMAPRRNRYLFDTDLFVAAAGENKPKEIHDRRARDRIGDAQGAPLIRRNCAIDAGEIKMLQADFRFSPSVDPNPRFSATRGQTDVDVVRIGSGRDDNICGALDPSLAEDLFIESRADDIQLVRADKVSLFSRGHFDAYVKDFEASSSAARDWLVEHLSR